MGASVQFIALKTETPKVVKGAPLTLRLRSAPWNRFQLGA